MTADKPREAIQPRHRNAWTKWLVLRALGMRGWRARQVSQAVLAHLVVMHAPHTWQGTWAKWLYPVQSIQVNSGCAGHVLMDAWSSGKCVVFHTNGSTAQLEQAQAWAKSNGARLTLCAWESKRRFLHVHAPFKPSKHAARDVHYMARYFKYFLQTHSDSE